MQSVCASFQQYLSEKTLVAKLIKNFINEKRARVMRGCIHRDMVEICLDHGHCLHHDANTSNDL